jgi:flavin reductase (DIM6/NTAB) family NADH-FMN oxidoreductase RutF
MQQSVPYQEANMRKFPEPVSIAIAKDANGICNPITLGWVMCTSHNPPMLAISIGSTRYSAEVLRHAKACVIAHPAAEQKEEALYYGSHSGRDVNKLETFNTKTTPAEKIDCVLLTDAVVNFECRVVSELETGDHIIFACEVIASHVNQASKERLYTVGPNHLLGGVQPI